MTSVSFCGFLMTAMTRNEFLRSRKTDWARLLHLPDINWLWMLLAGAGLVVVIWGILRFVSRMNEDVDPAEADKEMLLALHDLRREGDLTEDEFRSIKGQILGRLSTSLNADAKSETAAENAGLQKPGEDILREAVEAARRQSGVVNETREESEQLETLVSPTEVSSSDPDPGNQSERDGSTNSEKG
jgi:hypothetical protein